MAQTINLNIIPKGIPDVVNVSQFDIGRTLQFNLYEGAQIYTIPAGATAVIAGRKGDNHIFIYEATIAEGRHAVSIETTEQMTAWAGENLCQLRITKTGIDIATVNFRMMVQERPDANGDISDSDLPMIIALATEQELNAEAWAVGTKDGTAVSSSDPQYHNNSKYYKEQAATSATNAAASEVAAAASADHADATAADVDEAVQAVEGVVDTTYGMQDSLSIDVDGNPIEGNFAAGVADKLIVDIQPIQDLHGLPYPYVGGAYKNKLNIPSSVVTTTKNGITFTVTRNEGGAVTEIDADGTASAEATIDFSASGIPIGNVILSGCPSGGGNNTWQIIRWNSQWGDVTRDNGSGVTYNNTSDSNWFRISVLGGVTVSHKKFYPMVRLSTELDSTFAPYSNECPILGLTESKIYNAKNLFNKNAKDTTKGYISGQYVNYQGIPTTPGGSVVWNVSEYMEVEPNTTYTVSGLLTSNSTSPSICEYSNNEAGAYITSHMYNNNSIVIFTTRSTAKYVRLSIPQVQVDNIQLEKGGRATPYAPYYTPQTYTIDLEGTRYGVTLNVKTGVMTVNKICEEFSSANYYGTYGSDNAPLFYVTMSDYLKPYVDSTSPIQNKIISNEYKAISVPNASNMLNGEIRTQNSGTVNVIYFRDDRFSSKTEIDNWLSSNPLQVCGLLTTPITVQLTPAQVMLFRGYNKITANGNTIIHLSAVPEKLINYIVNAFGTDESGRTTASRAYAAKEYFYKDGKMYKVTTAIAQGAAFTVGTNCVQTTIFAELTALNA